MSRDPDRAELGALGERLAAKYLEKKGYRILERNFRCRMGEIDLIALRGSDLVFTEVKLRKDASYGEAREFYDGGILSLRQTLGPGPAGQI